MREIKRNMSGRFVEGTNRVDMVGSRNPNWKGDNVGYGALHDWIKKWYGEPRKCEDCNTTDAIKYDWANISGKYLRDRKDWKYLCRKCHHKMDDRGTKTWVTRVLRNGKPCKVCDSITTSKHQLCPVHLKIFFNRRRTNENFSF